MKSNFRNVIFIVALMALIGAAVADGQFTHMGGTRRQNAHQMSAVVDSVMQRDDVSRVFCRLIGRPHTSQRIDSIYITLPDGSALGAKDIDPIYFHRAFQWEEENDMPVEIDFTPSSAHNLNKFQMTMVTPYGEVTTLWAEK